jgi:LPXTG-motif cell wall-anchored protein
MTARGLGRLAAVLVVLAVGGLMTSSAADAAGSVGPSDDITCTTYYASPSDSVAPPSDTGSPATATAAEPTDEPTDEATDEPTPVDSATGSSTESDAPTVAESDPATAPPTEPPSGPYTACVAAAGAAGPAARSTDDPLASTGDRTSELVALAGLLLVAGVGLSLLGGRATRRRTH